MLEKTTKTQELQLTRFRLRLRVTVSSFAPHITPFRLCTINLARDHGSDHPKSESHTYHDTMRAVIQRAKSGSVTVDAKIVSQ